MDVADVHGVCVFSNVRGGFRVSVQTRSSDDALASYFWICAKFFGISEEQTRRAVANTNARYGATRPAERGFYFHPVPSIRGSRTVSPRRRSRRDGNPRLSCRARRTTRGRIRREIQIRTP